MRNYTLSPTFITRSPLLSLNHYIAKVLTSNDLSELKLAYQDPIVQQALFLASPVLLEENRKWQLGEVTGSDESRLAQALWRYLLRMSSRCTPFGLFAGVSVGNWANENKVRTAQYAAHQAHTRLDMEYLGALSQQLSQQPDIRAALRFYPNNSLYSNGEKLRYVDYHYDKKRRVHQIVGIDDSEYVQAVLTRAATGALPSELAQVLVSEEISYEEALAFIEEMIDSQVLISELDPTTTTTSPSPSQGGEYQQDSQLTGKLIGDLKENIDYLLNPKHFQFPPSDNFKEKLTKIGVPYELSRLFQTDLEKNTSICHLDKKIAGSLRRGISLLNRLGSKPQETTMSKFAAAFSERYESEELPLLEVLDVETGIGYVQRGDTQGDINPLVDNLMIGVEGDGNSKIDWNEKQAFLFKKLLVAHQEKAYETTITFQEIEKFEEHWDDVAPSLSVMFSPLSNGDVILENAGSRATRLLGRFTTMSAEIHDWCATIAAAEQAATPNAIIAEIVHLPENRVGNILMRTTFRPYEIPYLAQSSVAEDFQIPLQDLMLSVRGDEVILRSKRLNKRIIPALGNAHNYSYNALPVYHFLCDLQSHKERSGFGFYWGNLSNQFKFLPRVRYENLILHRATWQFKKTDYELLTKSKNDELMQNVAAFRQQWNMPERVLMVQGDNELLIDFRHELSVQTLVQEIKNLSNITLAEFLFDEQNALVQDEQGCNYTNECVAVFLKEKVESEKAGEKEREKEKRVERENINNLNLINSTNNLNRSFSTGSEWLYFKIYCGAATADELLCSYIFPVIQAMEDEGLLEKWFFIRYADPKNHLRIRFRLSNKKHLGAVTQAFYDALEMPLAQKQIWKLQTDTYEREIERYGAATMELSETLFCIDSNATLDLLSNLEHFQSDYRWLYAMISIDALFNAFDYSLSQKTRLMEHLKTAFAKEHGMNKHLRKQLNEKYATFDTSIKTLFLAEAEDDNLAFLQRHAALKQADFTPIALKIKQLCNENQLNDLLGSYIHMMLNRLFKSKQRTYEMVVYDFVYKNYQRMGFVK